MGPATTNDVSPNKPTERTALAPEPELQLEQVPPSGTPQKRAEADEREPAVAEDVGQEGPLNHEEPVSEAEKELWATVEETATEGAKDRSDEAETQEEGGMTGG